MSTESTEVVEEPVTMLRRIEKAEIAGKEAGTLIHLDPLQGGRERPKLEVQATMMQAEGSLQEPGIPGEQAGANQEVTKIKEEARMAFK